MKSHIKRSLNHRKVLRLDRSIDLPNTLIIIFQQLRRSNYDNFIITVYDLNKGQRLDGYGDRHGLWRLQDF